MGRLVGELFDDGFVNGELIWTQPGGTGSQVFPAQALGERVAMFTYGCQHWSNHIDIRKDVSTGDPTVQSAFLCCPLCLYVNRIVTPYEEIYNGTSNYIILP